MPWQDTFCQGKLDLGFLMWKNLSLQWTQGHHPQQRRGLPAAQGVNTFRWYSTKVMKETVPC